MSQTSAGRIPPEARAERPVRKGAGAAPSGPVWLRIARRAFLLFGSYGMAVGLLLVLMLLTFLGTVSQTWMSLYDVQKKYFESPFFVERVGPLSVPLPGASLVLAVLALNLIVGGLIRIRKRATTIGVMVVHVGILFLFVSGLVEYLRSEKGQLTLYEGESGAAFKSYYEWEILARERKAGGAATDHVFGAGELEGLDPEDTARFVSDRLPFTVVVTAWMRNGEPAPGGGRETGGIRLVAREPEMNAERNVPGALVTLQPKAGAESVQRTWLWGGQRLPWVVRSAGRVFEIDLRHREWELPFSVTLNRFERELHPGTGMAARFSSYVTKQEGRSARDVHITMNEPLRHKGYTLYQSGWGPEKAGPNEKLFSTFSVVHNPSDRWPLYACIVIGIGLLFHFGWKLSLYIARELQKRSAVVRSPA